MTNKRLSGLSLLLFLSASACTPSARWGDRAFYSPAHRGYVVSAEAADDRPEAWSQTLVLADPLAGDKLVCKEDVETFLPAHARKNADDVKRENILMGTMLGLAPITSLGVLGLYVGGIGLAYGMGPAYLAVPEAEAHYHEGKGHFKKGRFGAARQEFELALAGDDGLAHRTKVLFELGRTYEKLEDPDLALRSYQAFVRRAFVPAEAEYMRAEAYLEAAGTPPPACQSREEIEVIWP